MKANHSARIQRRSFLTTLGSLTVFSIIGGGTRQALAEPRKGRLKQAVCPGVFGKANLDFEGKCREAARLGLYGIDLVGPDTFPMLKKYGLIPTMVPGGSGIQSGINDKKNHAEIDRRMREAIKATADAGAPNVIVLAGDRKGISDEEGMDNCVAFLNNIKGLAEE